MSIQKDVECTACKGSGEQGLDDMGAPVTCDACCGRGTRRIIIRRDPVLLRELINVEEL